MISREPADARILFVFFVFVVVSFSCFVFVPNERGRILLNTRSMLGSFLPLCLSI